MRSRFKRLGGGSLGPHYRLLFSMIQACCAHLLFLFKFHCGDLGAMILSTNVLETLVAFLFLRIGIQWWLTGVYAAADAFIAWQDLPPPWPDEVYYHWYPRHHRKFGVYYTARRADIIKFAILSLLSSYCQSLEQVLLTPIHPLDFAWHTTKWEHDRHPLPPPYASVKQSDVDNLLGDSDPSHIMDIFKFGDAPLSHTITTPAQHFTIVDNPSCFTTKSDATPTLIIDTGASVCVSPDRNDFISYQPSTMTIRDLSKSNQVAEEGYVAWKIRDVNGSLVTV